MILLVKDLKEVLKIYIQGLEGNKNIMRREKESTKKYLMELLELKYTSTNKLSRMCFKVN